RFRIELDGGRLDSAGGAIVDLGEGLLEIISAGDLAFNSLLRSEGGSIRLESLSLTVTGELAGLEAPNGRITLIAETGIGLVEALNFVALEVEAVSASGPLNLVTPSGTSIVGSGLMLGTGSGELSLLVGAGDLAVNAE